MSKVDGRTTSSRELADESPRVLASTDDQLPRWERWMTTSGAACVMMFGAAWLPRDVARIVVGVGLALALVATVQFVIALRSR